MAVTLKQVAARAGVSYQTVWRALHGATGILPRTRETVLATAARLGYQRNRLAGSLRTNQSNTIGLVVLDVRNAHASELTHGVEEAALENGFSVLLANSVSDPQREEAAIQALMERRVDGIILSPSATGDHRYLKTAMPAGFPFVAVNRKTRNFSCRTILSRDEDARLAARHLVGQGHREIGAIFGRIGIAPFRGRHKAFVSELEASGVKVRSDLIRSGENTVAAARAVTLDMISGRHRPTALFAAGSLLTEGVLIGLKEARLRHGLDIDVVGYDLRYAALLDPPLPVLRQPAQAMGRLAFEAILMALKGEEPHGSRYNYLPLSLVDAAP